MEKFRYWSQNRRKWPKLRGFWRRLLCLSNTILHRKSSSTFWNNLAFGTKRQYSLEIFPHICGTCINMRNVRSSMSSADHRLNLHHYREISGNSVQSSVQLVIPAVFSRGVGRQRCKTKLGNHTCHWNHNQHVEAFVI